VKIQVDQVCVLAKMTGLKFVLISITFVSFLATKVFGIENTTHVPFVGAHNKPTNFTASKKSADIQKQLYNISIEPIANVSVNVGKYAELDCNITGDTRKWILPQVTWSKKGTLLFVNKKDLIDNPRFSVLKKKEYSQLIISSVQPSDQGWYKCELNTDPMAVKMLVFLEVLKPENDTTTTPATIFISTTKTRSKIRSDRRSAAKNVSSENTTTSTTTTVTKVTTQVNPEGTTTATTNQTDISANDVKISSGNGTIHKSTTTPDKIEKKTNRKFDGWSFFGGIILTIGISLIALIGIRYYKAKTRTTNLNYNLMSE